MKSWNYSEYSEINRDVLKYFPFKNPRKDQLETISEIINAISNGYKYIILEAGTGTGKSAIATSLAQYFKSSYILTHTKQLQKQYYSDFKDLGFEIVKGRSNFYCNKYLKENIKKTCDEGKCIVEGYDCEYRLKNNCNYYNQKIQGLNTCNIISNYQYLFYELNYIEDFSNRKLMVFDEAHNLESILMNLLTCEISKNDLKKYINYNLSDTLINAEVSDWIGFLEDIKLRYLTQIEKESDIERISFMKMQVYNLAHCIESIKVDSDIWICDFKDEFLQFKPLKVNNYANRMFFNYADICLFMSATILDYQLFARWLGISIDEVYPIRKKSPFNINFNPIKTYNDFNLSYSFIKVNALKTVPTINEILNNHANEKGLIHTISSKCQDFLVDNLNNPRLITHNSENRLEQFEKFKKSDDPLVFISPSVAEGVDLPLDLCRFQIMFKLPRPDWGDRQIYLRSNIDLEWYDYQTCLKLLQMHGRGMRQENDYCMNYFIDNRLKTYIIADEMSNAFLPDTFKNAVDVFSHKVKVKKNLVKKGDKLVKNGEYEKAIGFFRDLCSSEAFFNDSYPYLKLSEIYHRTELYENEVEVLVKFLNMGINCNKKTLKYIKKRLKKLDKMGYFDFSSQAGLLKNENCNV